MAQNRKELNDDLEVKVKVKVKVKVTVVPNLNTYITYNILRHKNVRFCLQYTQIRPTQIPNFDDLHLLDVKVNAKCNFRNTSQGIESLRQAI